MEIFLIGLAALFTGLAWTAALAANRHAKDAVTKADEANVIATAAKRIAEREEARKTEISDVRWDIDFDHKRHVWVLRAVGNSPATKITAEFFTRTNRRQARGEWLTRVEHRDRIERDGVIECSIADEVQLDRAELLEMYAKANTKVAPNGSPVFGWVKVLWSSEQGAPGTADVRPDRPFFASW